MPNRYHRAVCGLTLPLMILWRLPPVTGWINCKVSPMTCGNYKSHTAKSDSPKSGVSYCSQSHTCHNCLLHLKSSTPADMVKLFLSALQPASSSREEARASQGLILASSSTGYWLQATGQGLILDSNVTGRPPVSHSFQSVWIHPKLACHDHHWLDPISSGPGAGGGCSLYGGWATTEPSLSYRLMGSEQRSSWGGAQGRYRQNKQTLSSLGRVVVKIVNTYISGLFSPKKSWIRETPNLSTCSNSSTDIKKNKAKAISAELLELDF